MGTQEPLASRAQGRAISLAFRVRLTPPLTDVFGETDVAMAIGQGLVREAMLVLKTTGEAEGFVVEVEIQQTVY